MSPSGFLPFSQPGPRRPGFSCPPPGLFRPSFPLSPAPSARPRFRPIASFRIFLEPPRRSLSVYSVCSVGQQSKSFYFLFLLLLVPCSLLPSLCAPPRSLPCSPSPSPAALPHLLCPRLRPTRRPPLPPRRLPPGSPFRPPMTVSPAPARFAATLGFKNSGPSVAPRGPARSRRTSALGLFRSVPVVWALASVPVVMLEASV